MIRSARITVTVIALAALFPVVADRAWTQEPPPAVVQVDAVRLEPLTQWVPVIGRLVARQSGVVAALAPGAVAEMRVDVGDRLKAGDVLAVLVTDALEAERDLRAAEVAGYVARLATARAEFKQSRQELARLEKLRESKSAAFPKARYEDVRQDVAMGEGLVSESQAQLAGARASLRLAEINLYNAEIRAPYPGVVTLRHTASGAYLNVGEPVVTLINDADMEIEADVPAQRIAGLKPGTAVDFELSNQILYRAFVRALVPEENPLTRTRPVRFTPDLDPARLGLANNQSVIVHVPLSEAREVVSVHKDAVIERQGTPLVFVVDGDAASVRTIELGEAIGGRFEVLSGLEPGDLVVVRGNERLKDGQKVWFEQGS